MAIEAGRHVVLVSKEVDSVVGPYLAHFARQHGKVVTPVDGDQPSLLIGLISWAQTLGFEIIAAGKASEYDFVYHAPTRTMTSDGKTLVIDDFAACWETAGRRTNEASFAGGVFVIVRCTDHATWDLLAAKGHARWRDGQRAMLYLPRHLLGLEAATSVLDAAVHGLSSGAQAPQPRLDLVARASLELPAGTLLAMGGHHHTMAGTSAELLALRRLQDAYFFPVR